jgi:peptidoglycan/xylan/chitin deacetylase (PgdA/CDA1 family)
MPSRTLVLYYHALSRGWNDPLAVRPTAFARQIAFFARGRRGGTALEAVSHSHGVLQVTFDDAYASVLAAVPVLEQRRIHATVFACAAYGDGRPLEVPELSGTRFSELGLRTLSWEQLRELADRGIEIGSHAKTHPHLTRLGDHELRTELVDAKREIEDQIGRACRVLAYPFGETDDRVRAAARQAGYLAAFGSPGTPGDPFDFPRLGVYRRDTLVRTYLKSTRLAPMARRVRAQSGAVLIRSARRQPR